MYFEDKLEISDVKHTITIAQRHTQKNCVDRRWFNIHYSTKSRTKKSLLIIETSFERHFHALMY